MQNEKPAEKAANIVWVDVRTPSEFEKGHVEGAVNLPLFSDQERAEVGTLYARSGKDAALERGLELTGPRLAQMLRKGKALSMKGKLRLYCWRGGMRSASVAWLLRLENIDVEVYPGGYKAYRNAFSRLMEQEWKIVLLAGPTLCGKTRILEQMAKEGRQVLDLEGLARHKGSAFGGLGQAPQPTNEQFSNRLHALMEGFSPEKILWCEAESLNIGKVTLPSAFYEKIRQAPCVWVESPRPARIRRAVEEYGCMAEEDLAACFEKIRRRIGNDVADRCIRHIRNHDLESAIAPALDYYDKSYLYSLRLAPHKELYRCTGEKSPQEAAIEILQAVEKP